MMAAELERVATQEPEPSKPSEVLGTGRWHCPADGSRMMRESGRVSCPACGRYMPTSVLYQIVEVHQHAQM